ncbi:MAG: thioredoxin-disulfide reductase [Elusimicrobia bacterium RIFOXYA2_FULL_58_8]|nr:MAG: thioredoxin-disulfide reductase [Elusimicrobia bacterium RIFOXYA12_FULL_57_11]OGS14570.1 MAG: thioredoxin-disulfide reductase [Elusimicrobia bacterium RIFOXYA2_FULL_58_8]
MNPKETTPVAAQYDLVIIGSGPAGFTAAIYGARGGLKTALFGGIAPGGQLLQTMDIENFPGFSEPVVGADLMQAMLKQSARLGAEIFTDEITAADFTRRPLAVTASDGRTFTASSVIVATGARASWLGLPSETKYTGKGVSGCATCDGPFYRGKDVCVIGGGDTAAEDALFLTKFAASVRLIHRRDALRASFRMQEKLKANPKIEIIYDTVLEEVLGEAKVTAIKLKNVKTGAYAVIPLNGVFIAIGHEPATAIFKSSLKLNDEGYIITDCRGETSVKGVFAAGDVMDPSYKQAIIAAGAGCRAAMEAGRYLEELKK